jgi:hypothetical protein
VESIVMSKEYYGPKETCEALPAWFMGYMLENVRHFGLMMENGTVIGIVSIDGLSMDDSGRLWIDVTLLTQEQADTDRRELGIKYPIMGAPGPLTDASIAADKIVIAFEILEI